MFGIEQDRAVGQRVQHAARFGLRHLPPPRGVLDGERPDRQERHQPGFALAEEELQDGEENVGRRRALRKPVDAVREVIVCGTDSVVGHEVSRQCGM